MLPPPHPAEPRKDLKVRIPTKHLVRLHSVKVLTGRQVQDTITAALDAYFETHPVATLHESRPD